MIITYESKSGICPHINEKITVLGKYEIVEDKFERYIHHICPIEENSKKHPYDQDEKYKYLKPCNEIADCPIAKNFKKIIEIRR